MKVLLHSSHTSINLTAPFPSFNLQRIPPFSPSYTLLTNKLTSSTNSTKPNKKLTFLSTQHHYNDPYNVSSLFGLNLSSCKVSPITTSSEAVQSVQSSSDNFHWMVILDRPSSEDVIQSKVELINYYVAVLKTALGSDDDKDAQRCIYNAATDNTNFGFCCFVDQQTSRVLVGLPGVLSVKPDPDIDSVTKDYSRVFNPDELSVSKFGNDNELLFPNGSKHWLALVQKPSARVSSKAQMVDLYVNILTEVLGNEKDAQMCLYHVSSQSNPGFCCLLDEETAHKLAAVPGVLSVQPDEHFESENKDYGGDRLSSDATDSIDSEKSETKLFITGLSFYTSEKTLRAAFESFGELVEVKVIMDKISKRSKGYAFVEYSNKDAATSALREMNGKIINGWMIVVDRAKSKPRFSRGRGKATFSEERDAM